MTTLHTFGCSITQGHALPDIVKPVLDNNGETLPGEEVSKLIDKGKIEWGDIHLYQPSDYAWPKVLADKLEVPVINYARRGACFNQIARQCATNIDNIQSGDIVIVMWTYLVRLSLQWPARTSVPLCNVIENTKKGLITNILPGFNKFFGLNNSDKDNDKAIHRYIEDYTSHFYLNPIGLYDNYYNKLILQKITDGFLKQTGARVIHLSVEPEPYTEQLETVRKLLDPSLGDVYNIPNPDDWYTIDVNHNGCDVIYDPSIPLAENDMHPSVTHHQNFANYVYDLYFKNK
jgi:hypothetical protein